MEVGDKVYRYETCRGYRQTYLHLNTYTITHITPCGYWIRAGWKDKGKWINNSATRRFAYPTKEQALNAYRHRKYAFLRHAKRMLKFAQHDLAVIESPGQKEAALTLSYADLSKVCTVTTATHSTLNLF